MNTLYNSPPFLCYMYLGVRLRKLIFAYLVLVGLPELFRVTAEYRVSISSHVLDIAAVRKWSSAAHAGRKISQRLTGFSPLSPLGERGLR